MVLKHFLNDIFGKTLLRHYKNFFMAPKKKVSVEYFTNIISSLHIKWNILELFLKPHTNSLDIFVIFMKSFEKKIATENDKIVRDRHDR